jgi:hypothetical protein
MASQHTQQEITPALTPEEWRSFEERGEIRGESFQFSSQSLDVLGARHKVAALALHGWPFGFTHDDVAVLDDTLAWTDRLAQEAERDGNESMAEERRERVERLSSLRTRIAALLPPRRE